jgi:hypothetical protein
LDIIRDSKKERGIEYLRRFYIYAIEDIDTEKLNPTEYGISFDGQAFYNKKGLCLRFDTLQFAEEFLRREIKRVEDSEDLGELNAYVREDMLKFEERYNLLLTEMKGEIESEVKI